MLPIQASTTASFGGTGSGVDGVNLTIENDPGSFSGADEVHLLLFPAVGASLRASKGTVSGFGTAKPVRVPGGVVTMSGTTASLPKRADVTVPILKVEFAADKAGNAIDPGIVYDPANNTMTAAVECTAAISYSPYETMGLPFSYYPELETSSVGGTGGSGSVAIFGTVIAFYPPDNITTFDVEAFNFDAESLYEMYRIVSNTVTTIDGEFEKPPNFPTSGAYPDKPLVLPTINFLETERVHEIGYMDIRGNAPVRFLSVPILEPYVGASYQNYRPPSKRIVESPLPAEKFSQDLILRAKNSIATRGAKKL